MHFDPSVGGPDKSTVSEDTEDQPRVSSSPDFQEEMEELEWVLSHTEISRSGSMVRFLSFICNKYFDGESGDIREHTIAVEALGRKESNFDSQADPIVRVTARTLRKKLQSIYESDGRGHPLQIVLPLGHYVPRFVRSAAMDAQDASPADEGSIDPLQPETRSSLDGAGPGEPEQDAEVPEQGGGRRWAAFASRRRTIVRVALLLLAVPVIFLVGFFFGRRATPPTHTSGEGLKWGDPAWSDEFDGAAQQLPDPSKWTYELGDPNGMGGREIYCSPAGGHSRECDPRRPNAFQDGAGHLVLRAERNSDGVWTTVKMTTKSLKNFQYGRVEARMKMPVGTGLWPSFLMVGANRDTVGWPASGSVDIVENVSLVPGTNGLGPNMIRSTVHGPRYFGGNGLWHDFRLPNGARVDDASFHTYGIIWSPGMIQFYVDDPANIYYVQNASDLPEGGEWVFDHPFYLMMMLAIGGEWPGDPDATTPNPADTLVDFVRVYNIPPVAAPSVQWPSVRVKAGSSAASTISLHAPAYSGRVHLACSTDTPTTTCSLATSVVNFSDTLSQEDTLTISTNLFTEKGRIVASPGRYKVTITATTISGDRSQVTVPFEVKNDE